MDLFITYLFEDTWFFFSWAIIIVFSICVHEYAHAWVALRCGDSTAADEGHLTLNPLVQMGPMSLFLLAIIGIAWGAVPVNPGRFRNRLSAALVAFAGPFSNLVLSLLAAVLAVLFASMPNASEFFEYASMANAVLFVLNMLPVPMLDGWSVFSMLVPAMERVSREQGRTISLFVLMAIFATPLGGLVWQAGKGLSAVWFRLMV